MIIWCWIQTKTVYNFKARKSHCCASEALDLEQTVFSTGSANDGKMGVRIFNSDGSEAAISGNGVVVSENI